MNDLEYSITIITTYAEFLYIGFGLAIRIKNNKNREMGDFKKNTCNHKILEIIPPLSKGSFHIQDSRWAWFPVSVTSIFH